MKIIFLILLCLLIQLSSFASVYDSEICERNNDNVINHLTNSENRLSFRNGGGLFNGGVCWWHSRFERVSAYLMEFRPEDEKLPSNLLKTRLMNLTFMKMTVIPGYHNLKELSEENKELIQKILNQWQARDGFINQAWIQGIQGKTHLPAEKLKQHMDHIFEIFQKQRKPYFLMLQLPSVVAHAFLLVDMLKTSQGYKLFVIDSNAPGKVITQDYISGTKSLIYKSSPYVPYLGYAQDFLKIKTERLNFCHEI
jgi:hypothetical protein